MGLSPKDPRKYKKYSLGMKQRLGIAGAVLGDPDFIILGEPFNALDAEGGQRVHDLILQKKSLGKLVVLACHAAEELETLADEIICMEKGRIVRAAPKEAG